MKKRSLPLVLMGLLITSFLALPARAFEGMTTGPEHSRIKDILQRGYGPGPGFVNELAALTQMVDQAEKQFGKNSRQVGVLLTDIGEAALLQAKMLQGGEQVDKLRRAIKALETGAEMLKPYQAESDGYIFSRARAYRLAGEAHLQLGEKKAAEKALRAGLAVHWKRFDDNHYQLRFFPTLFAAIDDPAEKLKVAEAEAKIARKVHNLPEGSGQVDVASAEHRIRRAKSLSNPLAGQFDEVRRRADELATSGRPDLAIGALMEGLQLATDDSTKALFVARVKPEAFFLYPDPDAARQTDWGDVQEGLQFTPYDHVAIKFLVENRLQPFVSEGRNNLMALLGMLVEMYERGETDNARAFCRLIPWGYSGYETFEPSEGTYPGIPTFCANTISWAAWMRQQGDIGAGMNYLALGLDLLPPTEQQTEEQKHFRVLSLREQAVSEAYYGSPDAFLSVLEKLLEVDEQVPADLLFYASVIMDEPDRLERAGLPLFLPQTLTAPPEDTAPGPASKLAFVGPKLASAFCERGSPNISDFTRATFCVSEGIAGAMSIDDLKTAGMRIGLESEGKMQSAANWRVLTFANHPDLADVKPAVRSWFSPGESEKFQERLLTQKEKRFLNNPQSYDDYVNSTPPEVALDNRYAADFDPVLVMDALIASGRTDLARTWAEFAAERHQSASPPQTIFSLWLSEVYEEQSYQDGWRWMILGRPLLAEYVFSKHVPDPSNGFKRGSESGEVDLASLSWERSLGAFHGRMLAREKLGLLEDARADARSLADYMHFLLGLQSFSRNETRELIVRVARPTLSTALELLASQDMPDAGDIDSMLRIAQMMRASGTGATIARLGARLASISPELAALAKSREDLRQTWLALSKDQIEERKALADRLDDLDEQLQQAFPRYVELAGTIDVSVDDVVSGLTDRQAILAYFNAGHQLLAVSLTSKGAQFRRIGAGLDIADLARDVRRGLELRGGRLPAFRAGAALKLYQQAVAPLRDTWPATVEQVTVVAEGALQSLPFSVLLMAEANEDQFATAEWFGDRYVVSAMPTLASLVLMRNADKSPPPGRPFLGIGDPELDGEPDRTRGVTVSDIISARGATNVDAIRALPRLPETADELKALQKILGGGEDAIKLGADASETFVRSADLANIRTLAFATHGLLAGEVSGVQEPGLVLTPPSRASNADDGYLAASEVAALNLDADLVLLSACNTAGPSQLGAEGLSGLARAFFFAGARALIVSHWSVDSAATTTLMTTLFNLRAQDSTKTYSAALHLAMRELRRLDGGKFAHPLFWGGFEVVGVR
jgi:CHAT domain-containing protein